MAANREMAKADRGRGDVGDALLHLRTVHFALVVVSFVLLSAYFLSGPAEVHRAQVQLREIRRLVANWDPDWLRKQAQIRAAEHKVLLNANWPSQLWMIAVDDGGRSAAIHLEPPYWALEDPPFESSPDLESLDDFSRFWDHLESAEVTVSIATNLFGIGVIWRLRTEVVDSRPDATVSRILIDSIAYPIEGFTVSGRPAPPDTI